ncbi:hypothetical protein DFH06DRAFT_609599 [Mycena polygramma]|nr:hypothetical protein DFH06DRAFT_609599 [Mycena polygramma]
MHRALGIVEVVGMVCDNLIVENPITRGALAALAGTSQIFHDAALDKLWRTQRSLIPLLSCMPQHLFNINPRLASDETPLRLVRSIIAKDWVRALTYANRVHTFSLEYHPGLADILQELTLCVPFGSIYPNLKTLEWSAEEELRHIRILLTSGLSSISLGCSISIINCSIISMLGSGCPQLNDVTISFEDGDEEQAVSDFLSSLQQLESVDVPFVDLPTLHRIAQLPTLSYLRLFTLPDLSPAPSIPQPCFVGLRNLALESVSPSDLISFFEKAVHIQLLTVNVTLADFFSSKEMARFCTALTSSCAHDTLETIIIAADSYSGGRMDRISGADAVDFAINDRLLRILACFVNVTVVSIRSRVQFDVCDSTLHTLARAWPRLTTFELAVYGPSPYSHSPPPLSTRATVESLYSFAKYCPNLRELNFTLDATVSIPQNIATLVPSVAQHSLTELHVYQSPISNPIAVARLLSDIFPALRRIIHPMYYPGWSASHKDWMTVEALLPAFVAVRREERARIRS